MKKQLFKIVVLLIFCLLFFQNCATEPEEPYPPPIMEWIVGTYLSPEAHIANISHGYNDFRVDNSTIIILKSDYTYSLYFKGYSNYMDSMIVISQVGTFEIESCKWVEENSGFYLKYYEGTIWFYPENENRWGSGFIMSKKDFLYFFWDANLITKDGVVICFDSWRK